MHPLISDWLIYLSIYPSIDLSSLHPSIIDLYIHHPSIYNLSIYQASIHSSSIYPSIYPSWTLPIRASTGKKNKIKQRPKTYREFLLSPWPHCYAAAPWWWPQSAAREHCCPLGASSAAPLVQTVDLTNFILFSEFSTSTGDITKGVACSWAPPNTTREQATRWQRWVAPNEWLKYEKTRR